MNSNLSLLRQVSLWGDYGDVLISGYASPKDSAGRRMLHRGGPFIPPVSFPWSVDCGHILVVTEPFRRELERASLGSLTFEPVVKSRIVSLEFEWQRWDRRADKPRVRPDGGEPEAYIANKPHSPTIAAEMPELWELLPPVLGCEIEEEKTESCFIPGRQFYTPSGVEYRGIFRNREDWFDVVVDDPTRQWFQIHAGDWVSFEPLIKK